VVIRLFVTVFIIFRVVLDVLIEFIILSLKYCIINNFCPVRTRWCCKTIHCPQEEGLSEVHSLSELEDPNAEKMLRSVLEELSISCARFVSITKGNGSGAGMGKTKLDKERLKLCQREIVS